MSPTVHQNPSWCRDLKINFKREVIDPCSARAREAVENDELIEVVLDDNSNYSIESYEQDD